MVENTNNAPPATLHAPRVIVRPRLIELMSGAEAPIVLLLAPAGYGKTTLLRQWMLANGEIAAISLDRSSRDVAALGKDLALALEPFSPGISQTLERFLSTRSRPNNEPHEIARAISDELGDTLPPLVIDDYQEIVGTSAETVISVLHKRIDTKLIISSRLRPAWATARQIMYGHVTEVTREALAMNEDEAAQILSGTSASNRAFVAQAEGWPAVLSLAARSSRTRAPADLLPATLHRFLADELFAGVTPKAQQELMHLALLPQLAPFEDHDTSAWSSRRIADNASDLGFADWVDGRLEMHPLIRDFLLSKLMSLPTSNYEADKAISAALQASEYDAALDLVTRFGLMHRLDDLITASFRDLISQGRVATLEEIVELSHRGSMHPSALIDLLDAELLFRGAFHERAEHVAVRAATVLTSQSHELAARAWWLAGTAAHLLYQDDRARVHLIASREQSRNETELGEAIWGFALTTFCLEEPGLVSNALEELETRKDRSPRDLVRWASGHLLRARMGGLQDTPSLELGLHAVQRVTDPHVRTGFLMLCAYHRCIQAHYRESLCRSQELIDEGASHRLAFVRPHALMTLALGLIGSRLLVDAGSALDEVDDFDDGRDSFFQINVRMLRARIALQEGRYDIALELLSGPSQTFPIAAIRSEYLALQAVAQAVSGETKSSIATAETARQTSRGVEGTALAEMAVAIIHAHEGDDVGAVARFDKAFRLNEGDGIITVLRLSAPLIHVIATLRRSELAELGDRSGDHHLARAAGRKLATRRRDDPLTPREREVAQLLRAGLSNKEIARALFISHSTAKLHVQHIFAKLDVHSRTQAVVALDRNQPNSGGES